jgi:hypothetical protein
MFTEPVALCMPTEKLFEVPGIVSGYIKLFEVPGIVSDYIITEPLH